jgi:HlyD family secretion protein
METKIKSKLTSIFNSKITPKTAVFIALSIIALFILVRQLIPQDDLTYSGTIQGREIIITSQVSGQVKEIIKNEGEQVNENDLILQVEDTDYQQNYLKAEAALKIAQAKLAEGTKGSTHAELQKALAQINQAEAGTAALILKKDQLAQDYLKFEQLYQSGGISQKDLEKLALEINILDEQINASKKQEESAYWQLKIMESGARDEIIQSLEAQLQAAKSDLLLAENKIQHTKITSPIQGRISGMFLDKGENLNIGTPVLSIIDPQDLWVRVYIPEDEIGKIFINQEAQLTVNTFPDEIFTGKVTQISDQAQFTPKNVQTKDQRTSTVFPVKIQISGGFDQLKPGITADVKMLPQEKVEDE